jgi:hypothetical protein
LCQYEQRAFGLYSHFQQHSITGDKATAKGQNVADAEMRAGRVQARRHQLERERVFQLAEASVLGQRNAAIGGEGFGWRHPGMARRNALQKVRGFGQRVHYNTMSMTVQLQQNSLTIEILPHESLT